MSDFTPKRFMVFPDEETTRALGELAQQEQRDPREQATLLIEEGLRMRGLLNGEGTKVVMYLTKEKAEELTKALHEYRARRERVQQLVDAFGSESYHPNADADLE